MSDAIQKAFEIARLTRQPETMQERQDTVTDAEAQVTDLRRRAEQADALAGAVGEFVDAYEKSDGEDIVGLMLILAAYEKLPAALAAYREEKS